jgi:hypothetical protein
MTNRKIHKIVGLVLILPMCAWIITGIIFLLKPGYTGAYDKLTVKTYPLEARLVIKPEQEWSEVRLIRTIIGQHLLVKSNGKIIHLDPVSLQPKEIPTDSEYKLLMEDTFLKNKLRYGNVIFIDGINAKTSTGIEIKLDWLNLKLSQKGNDTKFISTLYKIHYLQWSPFKNMNLILGILGLILLLILTIFGVRLYIENRD